MAESVKKTTNNKETMTEDQEEELNGISNSEIEGELEIADEEVNSLINDTHQSKKQRIEIINSWPTQNQFEIEKVFARKLTTLNIQEGFRPVRFQYSDEKYFQRAGAYILDSLDFLPHRPDLAFDFIWRAIDFLTKQIAIERSLSTNNDKEILKAAVDIVWPAYFESNPQIKNCLLSLLQNIPIQSCEYLFKRIYSDYDESKPNNPNKEVSRLVGFDGGVTRNLIAKKVIESVKLKFSYDASESRRKGSYFFYKYINGNPLTLAVDGTEETLEADLRASLNFTINGILYTFRNDRAHGGVFSPFRSSKSTLRTYAHSSFCFLFGYYLLLALIHSRDNSTIHEEDLINNYNLNIELYKTLYGRNLKK